MKKKVSHHATATALFGFLAPVLCVAMIRYAGPRPAEAAAPAPAASTPATPFDEAVSRSIDLRPDQAAAANRSVELLEMGPARSPFPALPIVEEPDASFPESNGAEGGSQTADRPGIEPPSIRVTSIMSQPNLSLVVVEGRLCGIGSLVATDWRLVQIDPGRRAVTVRHRSGREVELALPTP